MGLPIGLRVALFCGRWRALQDLYASRAGTEKAFSKKHSIIAGLFAILIHVKGEELSLNNACYYPAGLPLSG
jgi:hypothetical protein